MTTLGIALDSERYQPDSSEPVDRWFQAANASNARTTASILQRLSAAYGGRREVLVLDPFGGAGSTAAAARICGLTFYGIEHDPLLACVSLAKAEGRLRHIPLLPDMGDAAREEWLGEALADIAVRVDAADVPVVSALAVVAALRATRREAVDVATFGGDLAATQTDAQPGRVVCGNATSREAWDMLALPRADASIYTSPPFGVSSPTLSAPAAIRQGAVTVFEAAGTLAQRSMPVVPASYPDVTMGMLHRMVEHVRRGRLVLEHEPDDDGTDSTASLVSRVAAELGDVIHSPTVDRYESFSPRGPFTLISYRIR